MKFPENSERLVELDGFRALAISLVIVFHYGYRFPDAYPYAVGVPALAYGRLGVNLFFIISGFVIAMTLRQGPTFFEFAGRRIARLLPPMIVCSIITFAVMWSIETPFTVARRQGLAGFIPSWTFTDPRLWQNIFPGVDYIDGSYWSLFVEVRFYLICALCSLQNRISLAKCIGILALFSIALYETAMPLRLNALMSLLTLISFPMYISLFWAGTIFYELFEKLDDRFNKISVIVSFLTSALFLNNAIEVAFDVAFFGLFILLVFARSTLRIFTIRPISQIGLMSYSIYLLHQNIGVAILSLQRSLPLMSSIAMVCAILLIVIIASNQIYKKIEAKSNVIYRYLSGVPFKNISN